MAKDITLVTGFYDIGRGGWHPSDIQCLRRTNDQYFQYFETLAELKNPMVIVTSEDFADRVYNLRKQFGLHGSDMTKVIVKPLPEDQRRRAHAVVAQPIFRNYVLSKDIPEFKMPDYSVVTNQKTQFVVDAIDSGFVKTTQTAWIDFGYCRAPKWFHAEKPWEFDFGNKINLWILRNLDDRPIFDVIKHAMIYFMGCHIVGPTSAWHEYNRLWQDSFNAMLECGFTDDDQTTMLMAWRKNPEMFTLRPGRDAGPGSWYFVLREYNENHVNPVQQNSLVQPVPNIQVNQNLVFDAGVLKF